MARRFVRGDADLSGSVTLSDAIAVLRYLFAGGRGVPCLKAADTDDNGRVDLSDAVVTLCFLFAHGPSPEPPYPWCGIDESVDRLGCRNSSCGSLE